MFRFSIPKEVRLAPRLTSLLRACRDGIAEESELAKGGLAPFKGQVHGFKAADVVPAPAEAIAKWALRVTTIDGETEEFLLHGATNGALNSTKAEGVIRDELDYEPSRRKQFVAARAKAAEAQAATDAAFKAAAELEQRSAARRARFSKPLEERFFGERPAKRRRW